MLTLLLLTSLSLQPVAGAKAIPLGERFTIKSKVMGEERTVLVALPESYDKGKTAYPVLYLTDGDAHLLHTAGVAAFLARQNRIPELIVVGLPNTERRRDLTPPPAGEGPIASGKADTYLKFFETELFPQIQKRYRTKPYRVFAGHSFGGLFAVHAFLEHTDLFNGYIAVSPSLWWGEFDPLKRAETFFKTHDSLDKALFVTLGNERKDMLEGYQGLSKLLEAQKLKDFRWGTHYYENEDHGSVVLLSHYDGLKLIFDYWSPPPHLIPGGVDAYVEHFKKVSKHMGYEVLPPEAWINTLGYIHLGDENLTEAIKAFEWNVRTYADSPNVYDSLGEAYQKAGRHKDAKIHFKRAYKMAKKMGHPNLEFYKGRLKDKAEAEAK